MKNLPDKNLSVFSKVSGFSLVELLVTVFVIALLLSILVPMLGLTKEQARRRVCANNIRQFISGLYIYSHDEDGRLPSGLSESGEDEHTPVLNRSMRSRMVDILGSHKLMMCPWLRHPFDGPDGWYYDGYGYVIGYNYLGGHDGTPWDLSGPATSQWVSPQTNAERGYLEIVTELNAWSIGSGQTFAPHGRRGPVLEGLDCTNSGSNGVPSAQIGAVGGNIGRMDSSVQWKHIDEMKLYSGSRMHGYSGCFTVW